MQYILTEEELRALKEDVSKDEFPIGKLLAISELRVVHDPLGMRDVVEIRLPMSDFPDYMQTLIKGSVRN